MLQEDAVFDEFIFLMKLTHSNSTVVVGLERKKCSDSFKNCYNLLQFLINFMP